MKTDICAGLLRNSCREPNGPASDAYNHTIHSQVSVLVHVVTSTAWSCDHTCSSCCDVLCAHPVHCIREVVVI